MLFRSEEIIPKYGADLIRLWAGSADYRLDVRCSDSIFKQLSDKYLKIRNTARFILGNLNGFSPDDCLKYDELLSLDRWALSATNKLIEKCLAAYEKYEFFAVTYAVHNFCIVEMSNFYLDIIKDRLYCDAEDSLSRKSAQTTIFLILDAMVRLLAPILAFTSNEIWLAMPHRKEDDARHVMLNDMPKPDESLKLSADEAEKWDKIIALRDDVNKAMELARSEKIVGKPLDAKVTLGYKNSEDAAFVSAIKDELGQIFIVSEVVVKNEEIEGMSAESAEGLSIKVEASTLPKCPRCWMRHEGIGTNENHPELCPRCAAVLDNK